jgi:hypothetical protein
MLCEMKARALASVKRTERDIEHEFLRAEELGDITSRTHVCGARRSPRAHVNGAKALHGGGQGWRNARPLRHVSVYVVSRANGLHIETYTPEPDASSSISASRIARRSSGMTHKTPETSNCAAQIPPPASAKPAPNEFGEVSSTAQPAAVEQSSPVFAAASQGCTSASEEERRIRPISNHRR